VNAADVASAVHGERRIRFARKPPDGALLADLAGLVDEQSLTPVIAAVHELDEVAAAHLALETGGGLGKHVIRLT
jgi:NADPH:quinone reductase-like Zn-dependent oxidoreductase